MIAVGYIETFTDIEFLWLNIVGAVAVFLVGMLVSAMLPGKPPAGAAARKAA
jgi:hypothetical protein